MARAALLQELQRFWRGSGLEAGPVLLSRRRVYVIPTADGLRFGLLLLVMLLGSLNYNNSLGFVLTFTLAGIGLLSILQTYRNLAYVRLHAEGVEPVFAGETLYYRLGLEIPRHLPRRRIGIYQYANDHWQLLDLTQSRQTLGLARATQRRGRLPLGRLRLETRYPIGLIRAWAYCELDLNALVYPHPAQQVPPLPEAPGAETQQTRRPADDEGEFQGLAPYRPGHSLRQVHWKHYARHGELHIKQFQRDGAEEVWIDWSALPGVATEERLSILCRWVLQADQSHLRYGFRLPTRVLQPDRGPAHRERCLEALACFDA